MLVRNRLASYLRSLKSAAHSGVAGGCPMKPVWRFLTSVLLSALVAGTALAQRAEQIEISGFGSFTRYDRAFLLKNQFGGGVRIGYYTSNRIGIEIEGGYQNPINVFGTQTATLSLASASLVLNYPAGKTNEFYILGGYTRLTFGDAAPYSFTDNGLHGALHRLRAGRVPGRRPGDHRRPELGHRAAGRDVPRHAAADVRRAGVPDPEGHRALRRRRFRAHAGTESGRRLQQRRSERRLRRLIVGRDRGAGPRGGSVQQGVLLAVGRRADQLRQALGVRPVHSHVVRPRVPAGRHDPQPAGGGALLPGHG